MHQLLLFLGVAILVDEESDENENEEESIKKEIEMKTKSHQDDFNQVRQIFNEDFVIKQFSCLVNTYTCSVNDGYFRALNLKL